MASSPFCSFLRTLHLAQSALSPKEVPTLHAFANLAAAFQPAKPGSGTEDVAQAAAAPAENAQGSKGAQAASNGQLPKPASKPAPQVHLLYQVVKELLGSDQQGPNSLACAYDPFIIILRPLRLQICRKPSLELAVL